MRSTQNRVSMTGVLVLGLLLTVTSCAKRIDTLSIVNEGRVKLLEAHLTSSSGLSLRFGIVASNSHATYHADGTIKYRNHESFTLSWKDEEGKEHSGTARLPHGFSGNLELVVDRDGGVTSRNGE